MQVIPNAVQPRPKGYLVAVRLCAEGWDKDGHPRVWAFVCQHTLLLISLQLIVARGSIRPYISPPLGEARILLLGVCRMARAVRAGTGGRGGGLCERWAGCASDAGGCQDIDFFLSLFLGHARLRIFFCKLERMFVSSGGSQCWKVSDFD